MGRHIRFVARPSVHRRITCGVIAMLVLVPSAHGHAQGRIPIPSRLDHQMLRARFWEAAMAAQGVDSATFLDSAHVLEVARVLEAVRAAVPDLQQVRPTWGFAGLAVETDSITTAMLRQRGARVPGAFWPTWRLTDTGVPAFDALNRKYAVTLLELMVVTADSLGESADEGTLTMHFAYAMNVPRLIPEYRAVPGIRVNAWRDRLSPWTYDRMRLTRSGSTWEVDIYEGRGDCPAGCTWFLRSLVRYDAATGRAALAARDTLGRPDGDR